MKDTTREAIFNLVGGYLAGKHCFDLFAGTGAVGLESISRGCQAATFVERHIPTCKVLEENIRSLEVQQPTEVVSSDTFFWCRRFFEEGDRFPTVPWAVFFCPPYQVYIDQKEEIANLVRQFVEVAPEKSIFVVESDGRFPDSQLPQRNAWDVRVYSPAKIAVLNQEKKRELPE